MIPAAAAGESLRVVGGTHCDEGAVRCGEWVREEGRERGGSPRRETIGDCALFVKAVRISFHTRSFFY